MELKALEQLVAIEKFGTMSKAAEELRISQPSISRAMQTLETELGCALFDRARNRVVLNDAGHIAVEGAKRVLADVRVMQDELAEHEKQLRTVRIGSVAPAPMWRVTEKATDAYPGTIFSTEYVEESALERALLNRSVDLAILRRPLALPSVVTKQIMTESLSISVPLDDPFASKDHVTWDDINGKPFLVMESIGFWMDIKHERIPDSQLIVQTDSTVFNQLVHSTSIYSFVTDVTEGIRQYKDRKSIPIWGPGATATFYLAWMRGASEQITRVGALFE